MTDQEFLTQLKAELEKIRVPVGAIIPYRGTTAPDGWLVVNGQNVYESVYPGLYNFLKAQPNAETGTDGTGAYVKCELPHHRVIELTTTVSEVGQLVEAGLPDIEGTLGYDRFIHFAKGYAYGKGSFSDEAGVTGSYKIEFDGYERNQAESGINVQFSASRSSAIFGRSNTNQSSALRLLAIIKW